MIRTLGLHFVIFLFFGVSCKAPNRNNKIDKEYGQIITPLGEIIIELSDLTPHHKASFIQLANEGYWDSLTFNRVIEGFVAQGGCPDTPEGFADSPYLMDAELNDSLKHVYGAIGAGRDDNPEKRSAACQFYIVQAKDGIPRLDGNYTIFGQVIKGMDVVDEIVRQTKDSLDQPLVDITMDINIIQLKSE